MAISAAVLNASGMIVDIAALGWLWRDWQYDQNSWADWRKSRDAFLKRAVASLEADWRKFSKPSVQKPIWLDLSPAELEELMVRFPSRGFDDSAKTRLISAVTQEFGAGPSDEELFSIRKNLERIILAQSGVSAFKMFVRRRTITIAFAMLMAGLILQLIGSWPDAWIPY